MALSSIQSKVCPTAKLRNVIVPSPYSRPAPIANLRIYNRRHGAAVNVYLIARRSQDREQCANQTGIGIDLLTPAKWHRVYASPASCTWRKVGAEPTLASQPDSAPNPAAPRKGRAARASQQEGEGREARGFAPVTQLARQRLNPAPHGREGEKGRRGGLPPLAHQPQSTLNTSTPEKGAASPATAANARS